MDKVKNNREGAFVLPVFIGWIGGVLLWTDSGCALDWRQEEGYQRAAIELASSDLGDVGFHLMSPSDTRIQFINSLPPSRLIRNANLMNGSGVALGDYDDDGLCDVYLCNLNGTNALFRNLGGWRFTNVTEQAGVECPGQTATGAVFEDLDGDGRLDLLVTSMGGPNACFKNNGNGRFVNVTEHAGLTSEWGSTSMALADADGDGDLDLYVTRYGATSVLRTGGKLNFRRENGKLVVHGRHAKRIQIMDGMLYELGEPDQLYLNQGDFTFEPVPWTEGRFLDADGRPLKDAPWDQGLSAAFRDLNDDGRPDLYVCNDAFTPDRCWINLGDGRFQALDPLALRHTSYFSMGVDFADINRDGHDDFLVVDMLSRHHQIRMTQQSTRHPQSQPIGVLTNQPQLRRNSLYLSQGDGTYAEIAQLSGVAASEWSWDVMFLDVDLDGWEDCLISNGMLFDVDDADTQERIHALGSVPLQERRKTLLWFPRLDTPNVAFRNQPGDLAFTEVGEQWGFNSQQISNGMAAGDLDNDGDLDLVINCLNAPALVYRNETAAPRVAVRLKGQPPNTRGIGARIEVTGGPVPQSQVMMGGGRYVSGDDALRTFAVGSAGNDLRIDVNWPAGSRTRIDGVKANHIYRIEEPESQAGETLPGEKPESPEPEPAFFADVSSLVEHTHHEEPYDDYLRQPSLPWKLSRMGPGVSWFDVDEDGREDLLIGSGRGGQLAVYRNRGEGGFERWNEPPWTEPVTRDQTAIIGYRLPDGQTEVLTGSSNYEDGLAMGPAVRAYTAGAPKVKQEFPGQESSTGPLALGDVDGDGDLDLFVGGRCRPGRYPEAASSMLFLQADGKWQPDPVNAKLLENIGLVNGALWSDLTGDGFPELILACHWGPVRILANDQGTLRDATAHYGMEYYTGLWNGVATGDFNEDGRLDIIASNWGRNTPFESHRHSGLRIHYGDIDQNDRVESLFAYYEPRLRKWVPPTQRDEVAQSFPFVRDRFPTHEAYGRAGVDEILGSVKNSMRMSHIAILESMLFINHGAAFEARPLPVEAQFSPAFGICVADFDGDGHEDLFLSQNFFGVEVEKGRYDAGRGLWLRGNGKAEFSAVPGQESGIKIYGAQRGAAAADYDADGRVDLVVTQNGTHTRLFHNEQAKPGLRVRLKGPPGNPDAIGGQMRLIYSQKKKGPVREIQAGSGYWSQNSPVPVLGKAQTPRTLWVRWPGGNTHQIELPPQVSMATVATSGETEFR